MQPTSHALVLNLHQPAGNLEALLDARESDARAILYALDRIPRSLWPYPDVARVHLALSGTLLESLSDPSFQSRVYGIVDCGSLLWHLQNRAFLRILGSAYYHPVLPLIPELDRDEQVRRWLGIGQHLFSRHDFPGFWPPEMGFEAALIPLLRCHGFRYVLVDSDFVEPLTPMSWEELRYRPHIARYGSDYITVVVRDRDLSNAQLSGMNYTWFEREVAARTKWCGFPPLVTTCSDGDNGGWFRNTHPQANFWGAFYNELLERARAPDAPIRPVFIEDYLDRHGTHGEVTVHPGAWNTGEHGGHDFLQWTGSRPQRDAITKIHQLSADIHALERRTATLRASFPTLTRELEESRWHLLRAQTSCNFFWGSAWVERAHADLGTAEKHLNQARRLVRV